MKLTIKDINLEAEIQGNPIGTLKQQLDRLSQKQDEDIVTMGEHINDTIVAMHKINSLMAMQISDRSQNDMLDLQDSLRVAMEQLAERDRNSPEITALQEKITKLNAKIKAEDGRIRELNDKVAELSRKKSRPVSKPAVQDEGIKRILSTVQRIKSVPISKYPRPKLQTERVIRESILKAGVAPHSSESDMHDKLGAKPRMPI
jgi:predicted RNase H-like nuclease (RuvC/YqgF family)